MGLINRFLLFIYALAIAFFALGAVALFLQIVPSPVLDNEVHFLLSRWELLAGAVVFFLLSIHFVGCSVSSGSVRRNSSDEAILLQGENGEIKVTAAAVKTMLEHVIQASAGVSGAKVELSMLDNHDTAHGLGIRVNLSLHQGKNVTVVSDNVRNKIVQAMQQSLCIENFLLDITVDNMSGAAPAKKQRVV